MSGAQGIEDNVRRRNYGIPIKGERRFMGGKLTIAGELYIATSRKWDRMVCGSLTMSKSCCKRVGYGRARSKLPDLFVSERRELGSRMLCKQPYS